MVIRPTTGTSASDRDLQRLKRAASAYRRTRERAACPLGRVQQRGVELCRS